eukprot:gene6970-4934_t
MGGSESKGKQNVEKDTKKETQLKKSSISTSDKVKLQLKMQRDSLRATMNKYERVGSLEREKAKELLKAGDKRKALYCLKREKLQADRIAQLTSMYDNIERLLETIENKEVEIQVFETLKAGKAELGKLNKMLNIDDIEKLMAETEESIDQANQINEILSEPIGNHVFDEDELLRELVGEDDDKQSAQKLQDIRVPKSKIKILENSDGERVLEAA